MTEYVETVLVFTLIFGLAAMSFDLLLGYAGLVSLAQASFMGLGAYCTAILATKMGWGFFPCLLAGILVAGFLGVLIGIAVLRLAGDYVLVGSVGFLFAIQAVFIGWESVTGGAAGLPGVNEPVIFGITVSSPADYLVLCAAVAAVCYLLSARLVKSPFGRCLRAMRDDEIATLSMGKNIVSLKLAVFVVSAGMAAIAGSLYAHFVTYVDPYHYSLQETFFLFCMVCIGGMATLRGAFLGALVLTGIPEITRFLGLPSGVMGHIEEILYGLALIVVAFLRPQGLLGKSRGQS
jgi:ABC-type branched-subunit amino acid transport system permease subunit